MAVTDRDRKLLWSRSGNLCAYDGCIQLLTMPLPPEGGGDMAINAGLVIGEEAHIVARRPDGPRGETTTSPDELDRYSNLILLCPTHHTLIDKSSGGPHTAECLRAMKQRHEAAVYERLTPDQRAVRETEELLTLLISQWVDLVDLDDWLNWTATLNVGTPYLDYERTVSNKKALQWMLGRVWPDGYPKLKKAMRNFHSAFHDFYHYFSHVSDDYHHPRIEVARKYGSAPYGPERDKLAAEYHQNCSVVTELVIELTKAANYVCDAIRQEVDPLFRVAQGHVLMHYGDGLIESVTMLRTYDDDAIASGRLYPGFDAIKAAAATAEG